MKAKVLAGGLEALIENPHPMFTGEMIQGSPVLNDDWDRFDHDNPALPLTTPCPEGLIIECNKVWQYYEHVKWYMGDMEPFANYDEFVECCKENDTPCRIALQPVAPISEKPKTPENRGIKSEGKFNSNMQLRLNIWVNGQRGNTYPVDICNAGYNMCLEDVVKVIEKERKLNDIEIATSTAIRGAIFMGRNQQLTDLLTKLKTK